jgi:hypothetical protein
MLKFESPLFQRYAKFTGHAEGGLSKDPNDSASKYVEAGKYHTNRGVICPTFQKYAKLIGVEPTYSNFISLTKEQANKVLYAYYTFAANGIKNEITGLILSNIYWGSGNVLGKHTRLALKKMGLPVAITGSLDQSIKATINLQDPAKFNRALLDVRKEFLQGLAISRPANQKFLKGWLAREKRFEDEFLTGPTGEPEKKNNVALLALLVGGFLLFFKK